MDFGTLTYVRKGSPARKFTLRMGSITLGSAPENNIVLATDGVAAYHARLLCTPDGCKVTDLGSTNGTFLNQVRLKAHVPHPLRDGDILRIGPFFVRYQVAERAAETPPEEPQAPTPGPPAAEPAAPGAVVMPSQPPAVLPPEVAAKLPQPTQPVLPETPVPPVRRLRGNGGPPRIPPGRRRLGGDASSYLQYLPACYHEDDFLGRFLLIFESMLDPLERTIDQIQHYFDPRMAPASMLPWLATWVDLVLNEKWPVERQRTLIRAASELYRWRGTRRGLSEYIRIYTGVEPTIIEPDPRRQGAMAALPDHVFRVIITVPDPSQIDRALVVAIIEAEKPAHTGYILEIRQSDRGAS